MTSGIGIDTIDPFRMVWGTLIFLAPGAAWTWALLRHLGWLRAIPIAFLLAFTLEPGVLLFSNLVLGVPATAAVGIYLSTALALGGLAFGLRPRYNALFLASS